MGYKPDQNIAEMNKLLFKFRLTQPQSTPFILMASDQARRRGGSRGSNEPPLQVNINDGGLKTQAANFHLLANSGELENKL